MQPSIRAQAHVLPGDLQQIAPQALHAQYLGTLNLVRMLPVLISPIVGWTVDLFSFRPVLLACSVLIFCSGLMTFGLEEPRRTRLRTAESGKRQ